MTVFDYILLSCTALSLMTMVISSLTRTPYERALLAAGLAEVKLTLFSKLSLFVFPLIVAYRLWG